MKSMLLVAAAATVLLSPTVASAQSFWEGSHMRNGPSAPAGPFVQESRSLGIVGNPFGCGRDGRVGRHDGGLPGRPSIAVQTPCSVGPEPCQSAGINLIGAALTAVTMAEKAAKGENVGDMFVTDPHPSEYQLYIMAKKRREAREAEEKAEARAKARAAASQAPASSTAQQPQ